MLLRIWFKFSKLIWLDSHIECSDLVYLLKKVIFYALISSSMEHYGSSLNSIYRSNFLVSKFQSNSMWFFISSRISHDANPNEKGHLPQVYLQSVHTAARCNLEWNYTETDRRKLNFGVSLGVSTRCMFLRCGDKLVI